MHKKGNDCRDSVRGLSNRHSQLERSDQSRSLHTTAESQLMGGSKKQFSSSASLVKPKLSAGCITVLLAFFFSTNAFSSRLYQDKPPKQDKRQTQDADDPVKLHSDLVVVNLTVTDASGQY